MVEETTSASEASDIETVRVEEHRPVWHTPLKWAGIVLGGLFVLVGILVLGLNTGPGRGIVRDQINNLTLANGLQAQIGKIDGSLYGKMILRDVALRDPKGVFATSPRIEVDWRPFAFANNHVDIRSLSSPLIRLARLPELKSVPSDPDAPLLPDLDIDVGKLDLKRIEIGPAVTGERHVAQLSGEVHIADRRAQIVADARTLAAPGVAGGDVLTLRLDAVPEANRLSVAGQLKAPANGLVAGLAGLDAPLSLGLYGKGDWKAWNGTLLSTLGGGILADLSIQARDGRFQVRGAARPGLMLAGPVERLTQPHLSVALDTTLDQRKLVDTRLRLRSEALALAARGGIDLAQSSFDQFRVEALLLQPGTIAENLRGQSVRAAVALNGPFATPVVDYKLQAGAIGFGETVVHGLAAEGQARVNADRILVPVHARAERVSGLNAAAGGLLDNVRIDGDLAISGGQILSDNLRLQSRRIDATAIIAADLGEGRYTGALKGRVNDYRIDGVGVVNVSTDADLYTGPQAGWGIRGRVAARTSQIFNETALGLLGGNAVAAANLALTPEGIITFDDVRMTAPDFRVTSGSGRYDPAGALLVNAQAYSTQYGPLSARVTGSLAEPAVLLRASRPGLGVGLTGVEARVRGQGGAYLVTASGGSDYGPFRADLTLRTGDALSVDIRQARFAGVDLRGRLRQTPAGPFAGQLDFAGSGIRGDVRLSNQGGYQRAVIDADASNARIPGVSGIQIGRAIVDASVVLYPNAPMVVADAQLAAFRSGDFTIRAARAKVNYRGGTGTAQMVLDGSSGVPFRVAANARLDSDQYLVALKGRANGIDFITPSPARIKSVGSEWRLLPTTLSFDKGRIRLAGSYGNGIALQSRLDAVDLSVINAFVPGLGIGGTASGSLDFAQQGSAFPRSDARLRIDDFTRSSMSAVSTPVDIEMVGRLLPDGGDLRALVKRGTTTVGRVIATLRPLSPGAGSWTTRLMSAPLSGGIRYNGPAGVLFSLAALPDQQLSGPVGVAADFSGRVKSPQLTGVVRANSLVYENETYGTRLTEMSVQGRFSNDRFELTQLKAKAGDGSLSAQGSVGLAADAGFPIDVRARLDHARLARSDALGASATGDLRITNSAADGGLIRGELRIPEARYRIIRQGSAEVPELTGVRRRSAATRNGNGEATPGSQPPGLFRLDIDLNADNRLFISGMGLEAEWLADLHAGGTSANPVVTGEVRLVRGTFSFAGRRFELTRGILSFEGGNMIDPSLNIVASTTAEGITASIEIGGHATDPQISFTSTPALPQDEVLARLLFGSSVTNLSATEALQLAAALNSLRGSGGGLNPLGKLRSATGFDRLRVLGSDEASGRGTSLAAGKYLTDDIYVEIITDARGFTATQIEFALTNALSILSQTGSFGGSSVNLRYSKDY